MIRACALPIGLAAAVMLAGCANRQTSPRILPVASPAAIEPRAVAAESAVAAPEPRPVIERLAVVQGTARAQLEFRDPELGDLRAPRSTVGDRVGQGAEYGAMPAVLFLSGGSPGGLVLGGAVALVGAGIGALTGAIVGGVQDAINRARIPSEKIERYAPRLQAAGSDLVHGPLALRDCVAGEVGPTASAAAALEAPEFELLALQGFSHALTLDAIELEFVREPRQGYATEDREERFSVTVTSRYQVHELAAPPRVVHTGAATHRGPPLRLDGWAAEQAREVHELAARGCHQLALEIGADLSAKFALAGK
jgi:hypothetical protein